MSALGAERDFLLGQITIQGNVVCAFCGVEDECEMSAFKGNKILDSRTKACNFKYVRVEDQKEVWEKAMEIGRLIKTTTTLWILVSR